MAGKPMTSHGRECVNRLEERRLEERPRLWTVMIRQLRVEIRSVNAAAFIASYRYRLSRTKACSEMAAASHASTRVAHIHHDLAF